MEQLEFDALKTTPESLVKKIQEAKNTSDKIAKAQKEYQPSTHDITDPAVRRDKIVESDNGPETVPVARLTIPMQKRIVALAAAFLVGNPIKLQAAPIDQLQTDLLAVVQRSWDDNKLDYESKALAKLMMAETEVAELWYTEPAEPGYWLGTVNDPNAKFRLRMKILANKYGDSLYPVYNNAGDMIAFGRGYTVLEGEKKIEHFDIYTADSVYSLIKLEEWVMTTVANPVGKIPVIYYSQEAPEWDDVQSLIDRFEKVISNHADTNDYFVSPMVFVEGEIEGFAKKGESGKVLIGKGGAKAEYLTWDQSPESLKLEINNLRGLIHDMTDTPDISIEQMKALGTYSGIALKMLFLGAHLKAADKEEIFGKGIQRRLNFLKSALAKINVSLEQGVPMKITPKFEYFLPKNDEELITVLSTATGGKPTMSTKTAVRNNPFVIDAEAEFEEIKAEGLDAEMQIP
jgi:SPP1 family phage portal protein